MPFDFNCGPQSRKLCEFYLNPDDLSKFCVGYPLERDETHCLIACLDPYGRRDGFYCFRLENLIKVQTDTKYLLCLEKLLTYNRDDEFFKQQLQLGETKAPLIDRVLDFIRRENKVPSFELSGSNIKDFYGTISEITDDSLQIRAISEQGCAEGFVYVGREKIAAIAFDSLDEWKVETLFRLAADPTSP